MNYFKLILSIIICEIAGIIGSFFTASSIPTWYTTLNKPVFNPPSFVFAPVWIILYFLMGVTLYILWQKKAKKAIIVFAVQLILNSLWSILFFGLKNPFAAFLEIIILWAAIILTIFYSYKTSKKAAYLLIPYLLWVTFASILNYSIWMLN